MTTLLVDLGQPCHGTSGDLQGLRAYLVPLIGRPFRLVRMSYGDELTMHFGDLRLARSPKRIADLEYGSFILRARGSDWRLGSSSTRKLLVHYLGHEGSMPGGRSLTNQEVEELQGITPESRVVSASPFLMPPGRIGLEVTLSDGNVLLLLPTVDDPTQPACDDEHAATAASLPQIADWELLSPMGKLAAGPGPSWSYEPLSRAHCG